MADVFISYKREERARVQRIARALQELGLSVWFDASLVGGGSFSSQINREVRAAKAVLVCWTPSAAHSEWVLGEAEIGRVRGVLAPTFLSNADLPPPYNTLHAQNLCSWEGRHDDDEWLALLDRLGALIGRADLRAKAQAIAAGAPVRAMGENIAQYAAPAFDMETEKSDAWNARRALRFALGGVALYTILNMILASQGQAHWGNPIATALLTLAYSLPTSLGLARANAVHPGLAVLFSLVVSVAHAAAVNGGIIFVGQNQNSIDTMWQYYGRMGAIGGAIGAAISFLALLLFIPMLRRRTSLVRVFWSIATLSGLGALGLALQDALRSRFDSVVEGGSSYAPALLVDFPWQVAFSVLIVNCISAADRARRLA